MWPDPDRLPTTLNVEEAGVLLGISRRSAYRGVEAGHIPAGSRRRTVNTSSHVARRRKPDVLASRDP